MGASFMYRWSLHFPSQHLSQWSDSLCLQRGKPQSTYIHTQFYIMYLRTPRCRCRTHTCNTCTCICAYLLGQVIVSPTLVFPCYAILWYIHTVGVNKTLTCRTVPHPYCTRTVPIPHPYRTRTISVQYSTTPPRTVCRLGVH